ncbi:Scy1p, partial [Ascoidea rubescens DSM 1968]
MFKSVFKTGIQANYSISSNPSFHADPWSVYPAKHNSTSNLVSVFVFDKKKFEKTLISLSLVDKKTIQKSIAKKSSSSHSNNINLYLDGINKIKAYISNLAKFKHPNILTIIEPIEDHSTKILFVTEYLTNSLSSYLDSTISTVSSTTTTTTTLIDNDQLALQKGILQISNAIDFLHNNAHIIHLSIAPNSIFINSNLDWKLSNLSSICNLADKKFKNTTTTTNAIDFSLPIYPNLSIVPKFISYDLDYIDPSLLLNNHLNYYNDIFSLASLIFFIYNYNHNSSTNSQTLLINSNQSLSRYKSQINQLFSSSNALNLNSPLLKNLPASLKPIFLNLIQKSPDDRPSISQFLNSKFFNNIQIKSLIFFDQFLTKSNNEKLTFLNGFQNILSQFSPSLLQKKILPILTDFFKSQSLINSDNTENNDNDNNQLISITLSIILTISQNLSQLSFHDKFVTDIFISNNNYLNLINYKKNPHIIKILIQNLPLLIQKISNSNDLNKFFLLPILDNSLILKNNNILKIQESLLLNLSSFLNILDFTTIKNNLFVKLSSIFSKTTSLNIKILSINSFNLLITNKSIDKFLIKENLFPLLKQMKTREPNVLMALIKIYQNSYKLFDLQSIISEILPVLWNLSLAKTLDLHQFNIYIDTIKEIQSYIELKQ